MRYSKADAQMTQGLAILCMVVLHLFCRQGTDVFGSPLLWINESTPAVFLFGFFAEICVPMYSICAGYGQELLWEKGKSDIKSRGKRIIRLMGNYWIVLVLFSVLGILFGAENQIPGSVTSFLKSVVLLHSYNGAWWYLNAYVLLMLLPPAWLFLPVHKMKLTPGLIFCGVFHVLWYLMGKLGVIPSGAGFGPGGQFVRKELVNLIGILAYVWVGGFLCRYRVVDWVGEWFDNHIPEGKQNIVLLGLAVIVFLATNIVHKAVVMGGVALIVFLMFNLWKKSKRMQNIMLFLGKHSTNIWLVHMFFYAYFLKGFVLSLRYPVLMLAALLTLSIGTSCVVMQINNWVQLAVARIRNCEEVRNEN